MKNLNNRTHFFDTQEGRSLTFDGDEEAALGLDRLGELLAYLRERGMNGALRRYAAGVARELVTAAPPAAVAFVVAAERTVRGEDTDLVALREEYTGAARAASAIGLRHGAANAAAFLTAYAACHPDPFEAAVEASRMARLYAELAGGTPEHATQNQLDRLLDLLPNGMPPQ